MTRGGLLQHLKKMGEPFWRWQGAGKETCGFSWQGACNTWQVAVLSLSMENKLKYSHSSLEVTRLVQTRFISAETKACCVSYGNCWQERFYFSGTQRRADFLEKALDTGCLRVKAPETWWVGLLLGSDAATSALYSGNQKIWLPAFPALLSYSFLLAGC